MTTQTAAASAGSSVELHIGTRIRFGEGLLGQLVLPEVPALILIGESLERAGGWAGKLMTANPDVPARVLLRPAGEPSSEGVDRLAQAVGEIPGLIVAIGGGSTIDAAKALALLLGSGGKIAEYEFGQRKMGDVLPLWALPTTCGSGSEVTPYAVINNSETGRKFTLGDPRLLPQRAIVDPLLLRVLDRQSFVAGCLDAFIHAFEARLSLLDNPLSNPLAEAALELLWNHLPEGGHLPATDEAWRALSRASLFGGLSIAHSRTGLIHTLSVALARYSAEPHGLLNARILPWVLGFNAGSYGGALGRLMTRISGAGSLDDQSGAALLRAWLEARLPGRFALDSAAASALGALADRVEQDRGLPLVNPRPLSRAGLEALLKEITAHAC